MVPLCCNVGNEVGTAFSLQVPINKQHGDSVQRGSHRSGWYTYRQVTGHGRRKAYLGMYIVVNLGNTQLAKVTGAGEMAQKLQEVMRAQNQLFFVVDVRRLCPAKMR